MSEIIRFTTYTVYKKIGGLNDEGTVSADQVEQDLRKTTEAFSPLGVEVLGFYDATAFRAEDDLILWVSAEKPEVIQEALRLFEQSIAGTYLEKVWQASGVHREHEFTRTHRPAFMEDDKPRKQWITIYPFVRSYEWYLLEEEERREQMAEHGRFGRDYPNVWGNTTAAFALGDYEWLLSFEADELHELVDMMRHLRYTKARLHVREELPFHVGRRLGELSDVAEILL
ncbi:hydrogen peroxide-dependent heme synthase [Helcobacillus massiliensis]|uniref:hydrogen peroxide-dependent heme synthase n=1 Tax=Helcobacillus massiliensis TaxID=521392 RepID=UPI002552F738|nr:hydrogen peroxide-dependent heme synthase [Helcobacillus massiliensis]MDK7742685.1 chlorite dismutase family protein [Helcobacillus massiliensis]WOO93032.1 hydrogen peroxide-dependent heme synthase [Helcobacillus massiliensis]